MNAPIKDSDKGHWVNRAPLSTRPFLQLSRLDRPIGYWLLALPGWIGLAFATLSHKFVWTDLKWAALILIGAIAMRGAGCTYNDIIDQDLDRQVERTALRPLPAGTITPKQAWIWVFIQCGIGVIVLLCLPRLAQIIALCSIPLVAAYPFMKRITWWPQLWLGLTFNWAVLVAYAAKTGTISLPLLVLYTGLIFWTVGYDTIYACQDIEDDMKIEVKSTARWFGENVTGGVTISYVVCFLLVFISTGMQSAWDSSLSNILTTKFDELAPHMPGINALISIPFFMHLMWQVSRLSKTNGVNYLQLFKSNFWAALILIFCYMIFPS